MTDESIKDIERIVKPGDVLAGKYLVDRLLGVGGMGVVVAATHTQLDQRVAIKLLLPAMMGSREIVERFQREARAAAKIKSEHVVRVSDVGALDGGVPYIVMEFLEGRDLGDLLERRGPLPVPLAIDYLLEACEALAEAHAAGIVHRDLKPSNMFLARQSDDTEIVKVLDFGISKQISPEALTANPSLTKTTDVFGSPTYMSPEQLKASRDVDTRADIWAIGVILHELLTGKPPFGGGTVAEIFGAILHQPAPRVRESRKDVHADLERVLLRCLEKDADKRYQTVAELADALVPFGSDSARESTARVGRILRAAGPVSRLSIPGARASAPSRDPMRNSSPDMAVQASTGVGGAPGPAAATDDTDRSGSIGGATATSWGHVKPAAKSSGTTRVAMVIGGILAAAVAGALVVLKLLSAPADGGVSAATATPTAPLSEPRSVPTTPTTVVVPAPSGNMAADPPPTAAPSPTAAPAGSSTAAPKLSGKLAPTAAPSAAPTGAPQPPQPPTPPAGGGDDEFGGRR